jgi:hypothetical protein
MAELLLACRLLVCMPKQNKEKQKKQFIFIHPHITTVRLALAMMVLTSASWLVPAW